MKLFFILLFLMGALLAFLDWGPRASDSVPVEFTGQGEKGITLMILSVIGLICLFIGW